MFHYTSCIKYEVSLTVYILYYTFGKFMLQRYMSSIVIPVRYSRVNATRNDEASREAFDEIVRDTPAENTSGQRRVTWH